MTVTYVPGVTLVYISGFYRARCKGIDGVGAIDVPIVNNLILCRLAQK